MFSLRTLRIKAMQYLFADLIQRRSDDEQEGPHTLSPFDKRRIGTMLSENIQNIHHLHTIFLCLMTSWALIEKHRAAQRIAPIPTPLSTDPLLISLSAHPTFVTLVSQYPLPCTMDVVERWYYDYLKDPSSVAPSPAEGGAQHKSGCMLALLQYFFKHSPIQQRVGQEDIFWQEDRPMVYQRLRRFIKYFAQDPDKAFALYQDAPSSLKRDFYVQLIEETLASRDAYDALLRKQIKHWRLERVNALDQTLIHMALTEMIHCPDIPRKVTINEYLEIAKHYSTPKSAAFINGIVDSIDTTQESTAVIKP